MGGFYNLPGRSSEKLRVELWEAEETIIKLSEIIAKLPKCWRLNDAKYGLVQDVPVVPGMTLHRLAQWLDAPAEIREVVIEVFSFSSGQWWIAGRRGQTFPADRCYNSREAAEFALNQGEQEKLGGGKS